MGKRKKKNKGSDDPMKRMQMCMPVPDDMPNWSDWERHEVMMSVPMEFVPNNLEKEFIAVICPVAKRRTVVSSDGWTCSYNKLLNLDRKFQSALPGGNIRQAQLFRNQDYCILDCLHLKAERTFFILDLMVWKQLPYYQSDAEFRFHWISQIEQEMDLETVYCENEYKFRSMPRFRCSQEILYSALANTPYKVDGLLFFHSRSRYTPGISPGIFWLPPHDIERVLGWKPPPNVLPVGKKKASAPPASEAGAVGGAEANLGAVGGAEAASGSS